MKRKARFFLHFFLSFIIGSTLSTSCSKSTNEQIRIAVSNSYIECAIREFVGANEKILRLAEPGMCPGHFDLQPSHIVKLSQCKILLKFDFQKLLDERILKDSTNKVVISIKPNGGLCCPQTYIDTCRQTGEALSKYGIITPDTYNEKMQAIQTRMDHLSHECHNLIEKLGLKGVAAITSVHQQEFCKWLGIDVVANFSAADSAGFQEIEKAINAGKLKDVKLIIANKPEGRRLADALAERLEAKVVVFGNFPETGGSAGFDELVLNNVKSLKR